MTKNEPMLIAEPSGPPVERSDFDPHNAVRYEDFRRRGAATLLWQFLRISEPYVRAYAAFAGQSVDAPEAKSLARTFGLRRLIAPEVDLPDEWLLLSVLPHRLHQSSGDLVLRFRLNEDLEDQLKLARATLLVKAGNSSGATATVPKFSNLRLAFLLRVLHCELAKLKSENAVELLAEMHREVRQETAGKGRPPKDPAYSVRKFRDDLAEARVIRDASVISMLREVASSLYSQITREVATAA